MKKLIALAVCLLITVSALAGCVARGDTAQTSGSSSLISSSNTILNSSSNSSTSINSSSSISSTSISVPESSSITSSSSSSVLLSNLDTPDLLRNSRVKVINDFSDNYSRIYQEQKSPWDYRDQLYRQEEESTEYEQRKIEYQQYSDMIIEFLKKPEIMELCNVTRYSNEGPTILLQDYNLDNVPEIVIKYMNDYTCHTETRQLICDLKTGKIMGVLYNSGNYIYIGKKEDGSEYVFVEEFSNHSYDFSCTVWSRLALTWENTFVRDRYLYVCNNYRAYIYWPYEDCYWRWQQVSNWYIDIPLEIGNSYKPYFLTRRWVRLEQMPQECETTAPFIMQCFIDREVRIEKSVLVGTFGREDTESNRYIFESTEQFKAIEAEINAAYSNVIYERTYYEFTSKYANAMNDFFAEDFWDEYTYMYEG